MYELAPLTAVIEYVCDVPAHTLALPLIAPGCDNAAPDVTANVLAALLPHEFTATTEMLPEPEPAVVVIDVVVDVPLHPDGNVHVYDVAPGTAEMRYVFDEPSQTLAFPEIVPG